MNSEANKFLEKIELGAYKPKIAFPEWPTCCGFRISDNDKVKFCCFCGTSFGNARHYYNVAKEKYYADKDGMHREFKADAIIASGLGNGMIQHVKANKAFEMASTLAPAYNYIQVFKKLQEYAELLLGGKKFDE